MTHLTRIPVSPSLASGTGLRFRGSSPPASPLGHPPETPPTSPDTRKRVLLSLDINDTVLLKSEAKLPPHQAATFLKTAATLNGLKQSPQVNPFILLNTSTHIHRLRQLAPHLDKLPVDALATNNGQQFYLRPKQQPVATWLDDIYHHPTTSRSKRWDRWTQATLGYYFPAHINRLHHVIRDIAQENKFPDLEFWTNNRSSLVRVHEFNPHTNDVPRFIDEVKKRCATPFETLISKKPDHQRVLFLNPQVNKTQPVAFVLDQLFPADLVISAGDSHKDFPLLNKATLNGVPHKAIQVTNDASPLKDMLLKAKSSVQDTHWSTVKPEQLGHKIDQLVHED
jgi:hydroxymethylpyrimidine pyrophosphatase-like HAD family hydrolase